MSKAPSVYLSQIVLACVLALGCSKDPEVAKQEALKSGEQYLAQERYSEASIEFRKAIQLDAKFGQAHLQLANTLLRAGDLGEGLREYMRAADLLPDDIAVQIRAGQLLLASGQIEDARTKAELVLGKEPRNVEAQVLRANALSGQRDLEGAYTQLQDAIKYSPTDAVPLANLAALETRRGRIEDAEAAYRKAIEVDTKSAFARVAFGNFLWSLGRRAEAEPVLREALALDPKDVIANRALAGLLASAGRLPEVEPYLKAVVDITNEDKARVTLADYYLATGKGDEAATVLTGLKERGKTAADKVAAGLRLASVALSAGDAAKAESLVDEAIAREPRSIDANLAKTDLLLSTNRADLALANAKKGVELDGGSASAQFALGRVLSARGDFSGAANAFGEVLRLNPRAVRADLELTRANLALGKPALAVTSARRVTTAEPTNIQGQQLLARALLDSGDVASAKAPVSAIAAVPTPTAAGLVLQGRYLAATGQAAQARQRFEQAARLDPADLDALTGLVRLDLSSGNASAARTRIAARLTAEPKSPRLLVLNAQVLRVDKDNAGAIASLRDAIAADPASDQAYSILGELYVAEKKFTEARDEFVKLAEKQPATGAQAYTVVGVLYQSENKLDEAMKAYEKAIAIDPRAPIAANNLAWLMSERGGNLDLALQLAQTAKSQAPNRPDFADTLGWVYYKKNLSESAITAFKEGAEQAPKNPILHYHLGMAYAQKGDKANARASVEQALALNAKFPGSDDARTLLGTLR
ncbi:MAG: tetratricopeptide repeat protein [Vicinamibacterales bacterium]